MYSIARFTVVFTDDNGEAHDVNARGEPCSSWEHVAQLVRELCCQGAYSVAVEADLLHQIDRMMADDDDDDEDEDDEDDDDEDEDEDDEDEDDEDEDDEDEDSDDRIDKPEPTGWWASQQGVEVHYPDAKSAEDAAREYIADCDYGPADETEQHHVWCWPADGDRREDGDDVKVLVDPEEPECDDEPEHEWIYHGARGSQSGGGVSTRTTCARCGLIRRLDSSKQDPEDGSSFYWVGYSRE